MKSQTLKRTEIMKKAIKAALVAIPAYALATGSAMAEAIDVTAVVTDVKAQIPSIVSIGGAVLLVIVALVAFTWVRRSIKG